MSKTKQSTKKVEELPPPTDPNTVINMNMLRYMESIQQINRKNNDIKDKLFTGKTLKCVNNSSIRNENYYMLDKYNLPIRKANQDSKKTAFGWKYNEKHEPINIHINDILLQTESEDIQRVTLQQLKSQFPTLFKPPRGIIFKIYNSEFPDYDIEDL